MTDDRLLRTTLTANAAISGPWGAVALAGAPVLAEPLGVPMTGSMAVGAVALLAAVMFWRFRSRPVLRPAEGWLATLGDAVFGVALLAVALTLPEITTIGRWVVAGSGLAVLDLAALELAGVRRLTRGPATAVAT